MRLALLPLYLVFVLILEHTDDQHAMLRRDQFWARRRVRSL